MTNEQLDSIISRTLIRSAFNITWAEYLAKNRDAAKTTDKVDAAIAKLDAETYKDPLKDPLARIDAGEMML